MDLGSGFDIDKVLKSAEFDKMRQRVDLDLACYYRHSDGSGVSLSSTKRPILNMRPGYIMWAFSRPREFSAELITVEYLEREASALQAFDTAIIGSHPEYPSLQAFGAYNSFARISDNVTHLGGNSFC